jgi:hypothetical protein
MVLGQNPVTDTAGCFTIHLDGHPVFSNMAMENQWEITESQISFSINLSDSIWRLKIIVNHLNPFFWDPMKWIP